MSQKILVFGSNLAGVHGAGAAKTALREHGAKWGVGNGMTGNSYALPTKDENITTLPLSRINGYVNQFIEFAKSTPDVIYKVTRVGCGYAGLLDSDIAQMFRHAPKNCHFDLAWHPYLGDDFNYWGAYDETQWRPL